MLNLSGCIEMLFHDLDFAQRLTQAKKAGLGAAEFWGWHNKDIDAIDKLRRGLPITIAGCTVDSSEESILKQLASKGLVDSEGHEAFLYALEETIAIARRLDIKRIIVTVGQEKQGVNRGIQHDNIIAALKKAAPIVEKNQIMLVVEPLNTIVDHKGYYLYSSTEGFEIIKKINSPNIKLLYDIYHQQISEGNLIQTIQRNIDLIGHFHAADVPGRNEPGTGEINYKNVFDVIENTGYQGYVGLEYRPSVSTEVTLEKVIAMTR